jgi:hypothetical protein
MDLLIPYTHGDLVNLAHTHGFIEEVEHLEQGTRLRGRIPLELAGRYRGYWYNTQPDALYAHPDSVPSDDLADDATEMGLPLDEDDYPPYTDDEFDDELDNELDNDV